MTFFEEDVATLLDDNWNTANTASRDPSISAIYDEKRVDMRKEDMIRTYMISDIDAPNGFGDSTKKNDSRCRIDIRTKESLAHLDLMVIEVKRIVDGKRKTPFGSYMDIRPTGEAKNLSDRSVNFYRFIYDVHGRIGNVAVTPI